MKAKLKDEMLTAAKGNEDEPPSKMIRLKEEPVPAPGKWDFSHYWLIYGRWVNRWLSG